MPKAQNLEVLIANSPEEREEIYRFRYRVLAASAERDFPGADHEAGTLSDAADKVAMPVYLKAGGRIAAALRIIVGPALKMPAYIRERYDLGPFSELPDLTVSLTDYLVVDTKVADARAASLLMTAAYKIACAKGSGFDFTNAGSGDIAVFERLGYRRYTDNFQDADFGLRVPMVLPTGDVEHLARVNSPFHKVRGNTEPDVARVTWFRRTFSEACDAVQPSAMGEEELWGYLTRRLDQTPHHGIPLLLSLDHKDAMRFLRLATVITCQAGEKIVTKGEIGNEMFVILKGSVEVSDNGHVLSRFGKGGIFGEMAYLNREPRAADVVARDDTEVLVVTQDTMKASMEKMPEVACRILFNLSLILTERLKMTSGKLVAAHNADAA